MATISVTKAGWTVSLDIPDDEQVMHDLRSRTMLDITTRAFQLIAADTGLATDERVDKLDAIGDLLLEIQATRATLLPAVEIAPEA
jgi:hypothetical protein